MPTPSMLMALAAIGGVLVSMGLLLLGVVTLLWNKLDKRFDDLETRQDKRFRELQEQRQEDMGRIDKRFDELAALIRKSMKAPR